MKEWDIKKTQYKVSDFISWQRAGNLILSPSFQRRPSWKKDAKSFLMDTVVRGLPIPIIFIREQRADIRSLEPKREVVDGQQRMRTIFAFIDPKLLVDFKSEIDDFTIMKTHNEQYQGVKFDLLPDDIKRQILDYEFSVHVLPSKAEDRDVLQIFARINSTGVRLNNQELRNAEYLGEFKTSMYNLASEQLNRWRSWKVFSEENIARMEEVQLTSDLVFMMLKGISGRNQHAIDKMYRDNNENFKERKEVERRFRTVFESIESHFGNDISSSVFAKKTLFYSLFAILYDLHYGLDSSLNKGTPRPISRPFVTIIKTCGRNLAEFKGPQHVLDATSRRTTNIKDRKLIIQYLQKSLKDAK